MTSEANCYYIQNATMWQTKLFLAQIPRVLLELLMFTKVFSSVHVEIWMCCLHLQIHVLLEKTIFSFFAVPDASVGMKTILCSWSMFIGRLVGVYSSHMCISESHRKFYWGLLLSPLASCVQQMCSCLSCGWQIEHCEHREEGWISYHILNSRNRLSWQGNSRCYAHLC